MQNNGSWKRAAVIVAVLIPLISLSVAAISVAFRTGKVVSVTHEKLKEVCADVSRLDETFNERSRRNAALDNEITHIQQDVRELKTDLRALSDKLDVQQTEILKAIRDANGPN